MNTKPVRFAVSPWYSNLFLLAGLVLLITGSFLAVDWMNFSSGTHSLYPAYAKPAVSLLCAMIAFMALRSGLGRKDSALLAAAFACILVVDTCMSLYVYAPESPAAGTAFLVGAALSIAAHGLLVVRHGRGFGFLRQPGQSLFSRWGFPLAFFLPVVVIFVLLAPALQKVGQFWPSLLYALILTTSLWVAWETVRQKLFPRPNALLIALGVTSWFITELVGVVHNIQLGRLSDIAMNLTWPFYMPAILLLAFSGHRWVEEEHVRRKSRK